MRVEVRPELLDWALERAALSVDAIVQRRPKFEPFVARIRRTLTKEVPMRWQDYIVATPDTLHGWPRFRDTRIPVSIVLDNLAAGVTPEELFADFPTLPEQAIPAALAYAAELARDSIVPVTA